MRVRTLFHSIRNCFPVLIVASVFAGVPVQGAGLMDLPRMLSKPDIGTSFEGIDLVNGKSESQLNINKSFIDNSISDTEYIVGMGDVFAVSILEVPSVSYSAQINQSGDVYISQLGLLELGRVTLKTAKTEIATFVKEKIKTSNTVYVTLKEGKKVSVTVNGAVTQPGMMVVEGMNRVWDCVMKANKMVVPEYFTIDLRNVILTRQDTTLVLDLLKYNFHNDITQNPYVNPGDAIFIRPVSGRVFIDGELIKPLPGFFPLRQGETLADLMSLILLTTAVDSSHIIVQKGTTNTARREIIATAAEAGSVTLENMDFVSFVPKNNYPEMVSVNVTGAVNRPGTYPFIRRQTSAQHILMLAGGALEDADISRSYILRPAKAMMSSTTQTTPADKKIENNRYNTSGSIRPELNLSFARLSAFEDYAVIPFSRDTLVTLEANDEVFIPFKEDYVYISGCVSKPGAYRYEAGKSRRYYITKAGGFSIKSDRSNVYTLTKIGKNLQVRDGISVLPGDIIVVPDAQNNKFMTTFVLPCLQIVSTLTYIVIAVNSLR